VSVKVALLLVKLASVVPKAVPVQVWYPCGTFGE
jgi:hypothetical protein